jgi:predicted ribosomally synthesized peptide with SipW-like signal peptide
MKDKNNTLLLTVIAIATLLVAVIGATFAYFTNTLQGEDKSTVTVKSALLTITFNDATGSVITANENVEPSANALITKNFTLTPSNPTSQTMPYKLYLVVDKNTFTNQNAATIDGISGTAKSLYAELVAKTTASATGEKVTSGKWYVPETVTYSGGFDDANATAVTPSALYKDEAGVNVNAIGIDMGEGAFAANATDPHSYTLNIYFKDSGLSQDTDKKKSFQGHIALSTYESAISQ